MCVKVMAKDINVMKIAIYYNFNCHILGHNCMHLVLIGTLDVNSMF